MSRDMHFSVEFFRIKAYISQKNDTDHALCVIFFYTDKAVR